MDDLTFFGTNQDKIDKIISKLEKYGFNSTKEKYLFHYLGVYINEGTQGKYSTFEAERYY